MINIVFILFKNLCAEFLLFCPYQTGDNCAKLMMALLCLQVGDLKGLFGLFMVQMQLLRAKLKILDVSYGTSTGRLICYFVDCMIWGWIRKLLWANCRFSHYLSASYMSVFELFYCFCDSPSYIMQPILLWFTIMVNFWHCLKLINLVSIIKTL